MANVASEGSCGSSGGRSDGGVRVPEAADDGGDEFREVRRESWAMEGGERGEEFEGGDAHG